MFEGSIVAIVTPFKNGQVDEEAYRKLIDFQIENGTSAIVPCGTTGESATLNVEEHGKVIDITIEQVNKRVPVIAGTGGNSTGEAIELTKHAKEAGADATLQVTPYYNKPTQEGLFRHYEAILKAVPSASGPLQCARKDQLSICCRRRLPGWRSSRRWWP